MAPDQHLHRRGYKLPSAPPGPWWHFAAAVILLAALFAAIIWIQ